MLDRVTTGGRTANGRAPRRRLKVLGLIDYLTPSGGAERIAIHLAARLDRDRFEPILCATREVHEDVARDLRAAGIPVVCLNRRRRAAVWDWAPLVRLLRRERIDVLHAHQFGSNVWGTALARLTRVPVVVAHEHTWSYEGQPVRRFLDRELVGRAADAFIAVSSEDRRRMREIEGVDPTVIRLVPNGIAPLQPPTGRDVRSELGIAPGAPLVGCVSVLRPQKALPVLVEAATLLRRDHPGVQVVIAGEGRDRPRIEAAIARHDAGDVVRLLGRRPDVPDLLAAVDVAVSSSDFEGSPLAVIEYMAAGKAIVATRVGGVPDLIDDGLHGLLVERRDPAGLARAVSVLLGDSDLRARLGAAARRRQQREFRIETTVRRFERLYEELFAASDRGRLERAAGLQQR